jgi:DNA invertase Pin-like site-specific DNA recombinase
MRRAAVYLRVSTLEQTTENQERELRSVADRMGCDIVAVHRGKGISGAKGRNGRPGFEALCKAAARREFDLIMACSIGGLAARYMALLASFLIFTPQDRFLFASAGGIDTTISELLYGWINWFLGRLGSSLRLSAIAAETAAVTRV